MQDMEFLTIADASKLIASGKLSPVELTEAYLARIAALLAISFMAVGTWLHHLRQPSKMSAQGASAACSGD